MTPPALRFEQVTHGYGGPPVLTGVDLSVHGGAGGVTGVLGNNGAGKSTLLKLASALVPPDRGKVELFGIDSRKGGTALKARTAYLPEAMQVDGRLTPDEFLTFVAQVRNLADTGEGARILAELGADEHAHTLFRDLSFGTRRKVGLAAVFAARTPLLILDEPGTGLDVAGLARVEELIRARVADGAMVLVSSHDMAFVARNCPEVWLLAGDGTVESSTPGQLIDRTGAPDLHHAFASITGKAEHTAAS